MAKYTVRIELHKTGGEEPQWTDYEDLHRFMKDEGFGRMISKGGKTYHLPHAEYIEDADATQEDILARAKKALARSRFAGGILVTGPAGWSTEGLKPA